MPLDAFKRVLKRIYFRHFHEPDSPPDRLTFEFNYFDSDFKFLRLEAFDGDSNGFVPIGYLPSHSTYGWKNYRIGFSLAKFPVRLGQTQIFRLQRPPLVENHVIMFSGINLYLGRDYDETQYFLDGVEIVPNTSVRLMKTQPAEDAESYSGANIGWTRPFVYHKKIAAGFLRDTRSGCAYFGFDEIVKKVKGVYPGFEQPAGSDDAFNAETFVVKKAPAAEAPHSLASFETRTAAKITVAPIAREAGPETAKAPETKAPPESSEAAGPPENPEPTAKGIAAEAQETPAPAVPEARVAAVPEASFEPPAAEKPPTAAAETKISAVAHDEVQAAAQAEAPEKALQENAAALPETPKPAEAGVIRQTAPEAPAPAGTSRKKAPSALETTASFFAEDENWPEKVRRLDQEFAASVVSSAGLALAGEFSAHYRRIRFDGGVAWSTDFEGGTWPEESPETLFNEISKAAGKPQKCDPMLAFELNRHHEWAQLALAYRFTDDARFAAKLAALYNQWRAAHPKKERGIAYASVETCADRLVSWFLAHELAVCAPEVSEAFIGGSFAEEFNSLLVFVLENALEARLAFTPGDALVSQILCHAVLSLVKFHRRSEKLEALQEKIKKGLAALITPDGGHVSGSAFESFAIFQSLVFACAASKKAAAGGGLPQGAKPFHELKFVADAARAQASFLRSVARPDGTVPCLSEYYRPRKFAFGGSSESDAAAYLQLYSYIFGDRELKFMTAGHRVSEIAMIFGDGGTDSFAKLAVSVPSSPDVHLKDAGYICLCSSLSSFSANPGPMTQVVFDCGRKPEKNSHSDLFSFTLNHCGTEFVTDPGSALFPRKPKLAEYMASHYAHNIVVVNRAAPQSFEAGSGAGEPAGTPAPELKFLTTQEYAHISASHSGYMKDGLECTLRRTLIFAKPYYVLLLDDIMTGRKKPTYFDVEALFHLSPDVTYEQMNSIFHQRATILTSRKSEARVVKITQCAQKVSNTFYRGSQNPLAGWHCNEYGAVSETTTIVNLLRFVKIPVRIYTLLYLLGAEDNLNSILMNLGIQYNKTSACIEVTHRDMKDSLKLNDKQELSLKRNRL